MESFIVSASTRAASPQTLSPNTSDKCIDIRDIHLKFLEFSGFPSIRLLWKNCQKQRHTIHLDSDMLGSQKKGALGRPSFI